MSPQIIPSTFARRALLATALCAGFVPAAAQADTAGAQVVGLTSTKIEVASNGSSYHSVSPFANLVAEVYYVFSAGAVGKVKSWKIWLGLASEQSHVLWFPSYGIQQSYPWYDRPSKADGTETLMVPAVAWEGAVKARCNELADSLRAQGLSDAAIFGQDRMVKLVVLPDFEMDTTGAGSNQIEEQAVHWSSQPRIDLVCKKWAGAAIPQAVDSVTTTPAKVVNKGLSIYEQATLAGVCKIRLDGWITTDRKHAEVSFRYRNQEGKQSQVRTVNTGESKTATFSHWYDIPNTEWAETGSVRMIGVSHDFQSDWAAYSLDCVAGGPQTLGTNQPPKLSMTIAEQGKVMVGDQICPERLKLVGLLEGRGAYSGQTIFFGPGFLSPPRDYSITEGQKVLVGADVELSWNNILTPVGGLKSQPRSFTFNVTDESGKVIASLANQTHIARCTRPATNPVVGGQGGLTIQPRQPAAPATSVPRLQQQIQPVLPVQPTPQRQTPLVPLRTPN